jgi:hypothetical protein
MLLDNHDLRRTIQSIYGIAHENYLASTWRLELGNLERLVVSLLYWLATTYTLNFGIGMQSQGQQILD